MIYPQPRLTTAPIAEVRPRVIPVLAVQMRQQVRVHRGLQKSDIAKNSIWMSRPENAPVSVCYWYSVPTVRMTGMRAQSGPTVQRRARFPDAARASPARTRATPTANKSPSLSPNRKALALMPNTGCRYCTLAAMRAGIVFSK